MSPCSPTDVSFPSPSSPSGPAIPGLGIPFQIPVPPIAFPEGFPEDLLEIMNTLQLLIPPGALKPQLSLNFGKDIFDGILKLLDQFMPFLMLYKFFLPFLNIIICIIEVLCALMNPFALIGALNKLFTQCIPEFLNLFPMFALIIMIISLLLLLLALIEYLITQILKFIQALLRNINALVQAFQNVNATSVAAIAKKLGTLLCVFQNLFVLLAIFGIIIQVIKDILGMIFSIPPCEGSGPGTTGGCCSPVTCPTIVQNPYTRMTGTFQYLTEAGYETTIPLGSGFLTSDIRQESWQLYDPDQTLTQAFFNIVDGYDIAPTVDSVANLANYPGPPKPVFFPTDSAYSATTSPQQSAYTINLRLFYNPAQWGRVGTPQYIQFLNCIVLAAPTQSLENYNNQDVSVPSGVLELAGGLGYLDDGVTPITGFAADGITPISSQATLENFVHMPAEYSPTPVLLPTDGYVFSDMQYTFTPNLPLLLQKNLVTAGCEPSLAFNRAFINNVMYAGIAAQTADLTAIVNSPAFPDPTGAQACLTAAVTILRNNLTVSGVAQFQATTTTCLNTLQNATQNALASVIGIGFSACNSNFTLTPSTQFTTQPIVVTVNLNENNGISIANTLPASVGAQLAEQITGYPTFGTIGNFTYDGYSAFNANLNSLEPGTGSIMVAFQNQILCTNTLPANGLNPTHTLQSLDYEFIYAPYGPGGTTSGTQERRDAGDTSRDSSGNGGD